jgi:hypothetical protein
MNPINLITDPYDRQARLFPALVLLAPAIVAVAVLAGPKLTAPTWSLSAFAGFGGLFLLSQLARGRQKEPSLYSAWGGMPSVVIFRHSDRRLDRYTKARYHRALAAAVEGTRAPTEEEEKSDPAAADEIYRAWSTFLRNGTRDKKKHSLMIFTENVNYGYRRNLWGMKPIGIVICALILIPCLWLVIHAQEAGRALPEPPLWAGGVALVFLLLWIFRFTPDWVKSAADAYAERLADAVDEVTTGARQPSAAKKVAKKTASKKGKES